MLNIFEILPPQAQLLYGIITQGEFSIDKENHQVNLVKDYFYDKDYIESLLLDIPVYEARYLEWYRSYYDEPTASMPIEIENFFNDIKKLLEQIIEQL